MFGCVIEGMDVIVKIGDAPRDRGDRPLTAIKMETVRLVQKLAK